MGHLSHDNTKDLIETKVEFDWPGIQPVLSVEVETACGRLHIYAI